MTPREHGAENPEPSDIALARQRLAEAGPDDQVPRLNDLAKALSDHGRWQEAQSCLEQALARQMKAFGPDSLEAAASLNLLAVNHCLQYRYYEARPLFEKALKIRIERLGDDHPEVARLLNNIGSLYTSLGDYEKSSACLRRALDIYCQHGLEQGESAFKVFSNLVGLYKETGQLALAEETAAKACRLAETLFGREHPLYATAINNLAEAQAANNHTDQAEALVKQGIEIKRRQTADHPELVYYLINLADIYRRQDKYIESEAHYQQALNLGRRVMGESHTLVGLTHLGLGTMYELNQEIERAEVEYQAAIAIIERSLGPNHPDVAKAQIKYARMLLEENKAERAEPLLRSALAALERCFGASSERVAEVLSLLSRASLAMGRAEEAAAWLKQKRERYGV